MTAPETPDELRARLGALAAVAANARLAGNQRAAAGRRLSYEMFNAWPAIDALLARLTAAEADADRLAEQMRDTVEEFYGEDGCTYNPNEAECLRLHDEALALRDPS